jgi:methyl-accepting chemotaxis protein
MHSTLAAADQADRNDRDAMQASGQVMEDVLGHVRELASSSESMQRHGSELREDVAELLVALQFQDRIRQILDVVVGDIARLRTGIADQAALPCGAEWLAELGTHYTMAEEHQAHGDKAAARQDSDEITFF